MASSHPPLFDLALRTFATNNSVCPRHVPRAVQTFGLDAALLPLMAKLHLTAVHSEFTAILFLARVAKVSRAPALEARYYSFYYLHVAH